MQHTVGKDMTAVEIGGELDFVDGDKGDVEIARHGFDGRHPKTRIRRFDFFFAGYQGHESAPTRSTARL